MSYIASGFEVRIGDTVLDVKRLRIGDGPWIYRRAKHRVGVHCVRRYREECPYGRHDRYDVCMLAGPDWESGDPWPDVYNQVGGRRPSERARRFWGGERRAIVRNRRQAFQSSHVFRGCRCGAYPFFGGKATYSVCPFCGEAA
jgi:hypothetical protein